MAGEARYGLREYLHAALRDEWDGLERINKDLRLADLFTLLNALMGLCALLITARYGASEVGNTGISGIALAVELVLLGVILDGVDGAVARMGKGNGPLGGVLDTLADTLTFVTTSTVVVFVAIREVPTTQAGWGSLALATVPLAFYAVCGLLRLARFESLRDDGKTRHYFSGIPTPAAAVMLLALVLVGDFTSPDAGSAFPAWVLLLAAVYLGVLMASRIRFPKLRGGLAALSLAILVAVLATLWAPDLQKTVALVLLAFMALYVIAGPFYVLARYGARFPGAAR
jgi:CDP-diacylglycerol---serine O-phosphatidyltransferase